MKVCLINPKLNITNADGEVYENYGLGYISSYLRFKEIDNDVLDLNINNYTTKELKTLLEEEEYDAIGISSFNYNYKSTLRVIECMKSLSKMPFVFMGGYLPTLGHELIRSLLNDVACFVIGEGEITAYELLYALKNGNPWGDIPGLMYKNEIGNVVTTDLREMIDNLDQMPFPNRYSNNKTNAGALGIGLIGSRGCFHSCSFCATPAFVAKCKGKSIRTRSPENVISEINDLVNQKRINNFVFFDEHIFVSPEWYKRFITLLDQKNLQINFKCSFRADDLLRQKKHIEALIPKGLNFIYSGFESFLESHLELYQKKTTVQTNLHAYDLLGNMNVKFDFGNLIFNPITKQTDLLEIYDIIEGLTKHKNCIYFETPIFWASSVIALHGTPIYQFVNQHGIQSGNSLGYNFLDHNVNEIYPLHEKWYKYISPFYQIIRQLSDDEKKAEHINKIFEIDLSIMKCICTKKDIILQSEDEHWLRQLQAT